MPARAQLPLHFDPGPLQADLERVPAAAWCRHFNTQDYEGGWSAVSLMGARGEVADIVPLACGPDGALPTPLLAEMPALRAVLDALDVHIEAARLMRLHAGARILEHRDVDLDPTRGGARLHVPVRTHADVRFLHDGEWVVLAEGTCWYLDFSRPHAVFNEGAVDRVHLVVDCALDTRLRARLCAVGLDLPEAPLGGVPPEDLPKVIEALRRLGTPAALEQADALAAAAAKQGGAS